MALRGSRRGNCKKNKAINSDISTQSGRKGERITPKVIVLVSADRGIQMAKKVSTQAAPIAALTANGDDSLSRSYQSLSKATKKRTRWPNKCVRNLAHSSANGILVGSIPAAN